VVKWVQVLQLLFALPVMLALGIAGHAVLARGVKAVLWSWAPLATGEPEAASYDRRVYHTADRPMLQVLAAAAAAGLLLWLGLASGWALFWWGGVLGVIGAVALDVLLWERVAVSAHNLWFQRGFRNKVHQVDLENIRDLTVDETEARGFTLRHGTDNRVVRLSVRMHDKRVVALPKTDARRSLEAVEAVANYLRMRLQQMHDRALSRGRPAVHELPPAGSLSAATGPQEEDLRRALARLRAQAAAAKPAAKSSPR
jgi:hypothetical protein